MPVQAHCIFGGFGGGGGGGLQLNCHRSTNLRTPKEIKVTLLECKIIARSNRNYLVLTVAPPASPILSMTLIIQASELGQVPSGAL